MDGLEEIGTLEGVLGWYFGAGVVLGLDFDGVGRAGFLGGRGMRRQFQVICPSSLQ